MADLQFEFSRRWRTVGQYLFPNPTPDQKKALVDLELKDRELEDFLRPAESAGLPRSWVETAYGDGAYFVDPSDILEIVLISGAPAGVWFQITGSLRISSGGAFLCELGFHNGDGVGTWWSPTPIESNTSEVYVNFPVVGVVQTDSSGEIYLHVDNFDPTDGLGIEYGITAIECQEPNVGLY